MVTNYGLEDQTCGISSDCNLPCSSSSTSDKEIKQKLNVDGIVLSKNNFNYYNKNIGEINEFDDEINNIPKIKDTNKFEDKLNLVLLKINICKKVCNFYVLNAQLATKKAKRLTLIEIFDFLFRENNNNIWNSEKIYFEIFELFNKNVVRDLPSNEEELNFDNNIFLINNYEEEDEDSVNCPDPAWEHLEAIKI
uniref:Uncharacterized protein n=1 Tax=Meloidogyne enterolobii TaxID=390850 RepID=A0A6V7U0I9_MELEN|nr:unnamed protein product [Meloidogyne enterolobii]